MYPLRYISSRVKNSDCKKQLRVSLEKWSLMLINNFYLANKSSCVDWYAVGARKNGIYAVSDKTGFIHHVYCDFSSEPNFAWTLVTSFSLENKDLFKSNPFSKDDPISEHEPNWKKYR